MSVSRKKVAASKFPLRLMASVRREAEKLSEKEGVSLNQFINVAVAEKLAHLQHKEWLENRHAATPDIIAKALAILDRETGIPAVGDDVLPKGYNSLRHKGKVRKA